MSWADHPNQHTVFCNNFCNNFCTKLMVDERVWQIKWWWIKENSLYIDTVCTCTYSICLPEVANTIVPNLCHEP